MNLDPATIDAIKEKQLASCPVENKIALIITGNQEDAAAKATFYNFRCYLQDSNGSEIKCSEDRYRYSQLLEFNEQLMHDYGAIRLLRLFPPKKWIGNKEGDFVTQRQEAIQNWLNELCEDEETAQDPKILKFFKLAE